MFPPRIVRIIINATWFLERGECTTHLTRHAMKENDNFGLKYVVDTSNIS